MKERKPDYFSYADWKRLDAMEVEKAEGTEAPRVKFTSIEAMQAAGADDGEILEINQVTAYFAYANRMVLGLGINTEGDIIGHSPGDSSDPDNWSHA